MAVSISEVAILAAVIAFTITQVHLALKAKYIVCRSEESWAKARQLVSNTEQSVKHDVDAMRQDVKQSLAETKGYINDRLERIETRFNDSLPSDDYDIGAEVENAVKPMLEAFSNELNESVSTHVYQAINQVRAQEAKAIQAQLEKMGLDEGIEVMGKEAQEAMLSQMNIGQQAAYRIANIQPSKKWLKEHPFGAAGWEMFKAQQMAILGQIQEGLIGQHTPGATVEAPSTSRGFGVR